MRLSRRVSVVVGLVCGAELVVLAVAGGAGLGALFGREGAIVGGIVVLLLGLTVTQRFASRSRQSCDRSDSANEISTVAVAES